MLGVLLYQFKDEHEWAMYAMFITFVALFKNTTLNFSSNLGHEGLLVHSVIEYRRLFSFVGLIVISLQIFAFPFVYFMNEGSVVVLAFAYSLVISVQSLVQNFYRFNLDYTRYGNSSFLFSFASLIPLILLFLFSIEIYIIGLIFFNALIVFLYRSTLGLIIRSFSLNFFKENFSKLSLSSLKLFLIRSPDSYFYIYFVIIEKPSLSESSITVLVYLISLAGIDKFPLLTPRVQENMDLIKSSNNIFFNTIEPVLLQFKYILPLIFIYLFVEVYYINYVATAMHSLIPFFPILVGFILLVIWKYNANSIIELNGNVFFKIPPILIAIGIHLLMLHFDYADSVIRFLLGGFIYMFLYFISYHIFFLPFSFVSLRFIVYIIFITSIALIFTEYSSSNIQIGICYLVFAILVILMNFRSLILKFSK